MTAARVAVQRQRRRESPPAAGRRRPGATGRGRCQGTRQVLAFNWPKYLAGVVTGVAGLGLAAAPALPAPGGPLARAVLAAAVAFWGSHLAAQLFVFDPSLWRGRRATVLGHLALVAMWAYVTAAFAWPLLRGR